MKKTNIKHQTSNIPKGFTMIELLVVIVIISIVASLGTSAFQNQRKQVRYNDALLHVLTMIKTARTYAITSRAVFDDSKPVGQKSYIPPEGYGVYIKYSDTPGASRFVLFANTAATNDINKNQFDEGQVANDLIEEEYLLPSEIVLKPLLSLLTPPTVLTSLTQVEEDEAVIIFQPPLADTVIAANDHPLSASLLTEPDDLYLEFRKAASDPGIPSDYVHVNRLGGFAEIINQ